MFARLARAGVLAGLVIFFVVSGHVRARADVQLVGTWVLDEAALRADVSAVMAEQFAGLPVKARDQAETAMRLEVERIIKTATGTILFRTDGTATATSADGSTTEWVWTLTSGVVRLEKKEGLVSDVPLLGTIVGSYLYLEPDVAGDAGLPLPLRRKPS